MKRFLIILLALVMVCGFSLNVSAKPIKLKCVTFQPAHASTTKHFMIYMNEVNKRGEGKVVLDYLGSAEVIPRPDQPLAAAKGMVDVVYIPFTFYGGLVPIGHAMQLTAITAEEEIKNGVWDYVRGLHAKGGLYWLGRAHGSMTEQFRWNSTKKISRLADLKGMRAGSGSIVAKPLVEALGASFTQVRGADVFTALERGVLDAYVVPPNAQVANGSHRVCKYILKHAFYRGNMSLFLGLKKWNTLPKDVQDILQNTLYEMLPELTRRWDELNDNDLKKILAAGEVEVALPPDEAKIFLTTAYREAAKDVLKTFPETGSKLLQMLNPEIYELVKK